MAKQMREQTEDRAGRECEAARPPRRRSARGGRGAQAGVHRAAVSLLETLERRVLLAATGFQPSVNYPVGGPADFVTMADLNGDSIQDMVVSSYGGSLLSVRLGAGNGTFQAAVSVPLSAGPDFVAASDLNGDGRMDLVVAHFDTSSVSVLLGNGNGTFQGAVSYAAGTGPRAFAMGDFNGDGHTDLLMARTFEKNLTLLRGNGNGTFQAPVSYAVSFTPTVVVAGDFNNDGKLDIAASDYFTDRVQVCLGNGNGTFQSAVAIAVSAGPSDLAVGDFNGDGKLDLATANFLGNNVSVLRGNGDGTFVAAVHFAAGSGATSLAAVDLNRDGKLDLAVANANGDSISVLLGNGAGSFALDGTFAVGDSPRAVVAAQLNGDTYPDLVVTNQGSNTVSVLLAVPGSSGAPVANAGGPYSVNEGGSVVLSAAASSGSGLTYLWDLDGDGVFGETGSAATRGDEVGATPTFLAGGLDGPSTRTVWLRVSNAGGTHTTTATINVVNVAPTLTISGPNFVNEGSTYTLSLSSFDPGPDTIIRWVINWGDGTSQTVNGNPSSVNKIYADNGSYTITATATDEDGTYASNSKSVTILNVVPTLTIGGAGSANEGAAYTLTLSSFDPGNDTIIRWTINWGDGTTQTVNGNPSSVSKIFADDGVYTITATATDEDGTWTANAKGVTIYNVAPTLGISGSAQATAGSPYTLNLSWSDPGNDTIIRWVINWGDGVIHTINGNPTSVAHVYSTAGASHTVSATATDEDGTWSANTFTLSVATSGTDTIHPTAVLLSAPSITAAGATIYRFTVKYDDNVGINLSFLDDNDIKVTGPNGYSQFAKFISVVAVPGNSQIATYQITAPGGTWDPADNGSYTIALQKSQVRDTTGNSVRHGNLGTFQCAIAPADLAGNELATALDLGAMTPGRIKAVDEWVGTVDRNDFYRFTIDTPVTLDVKLFNLAQNADLMLLDSAGNRILYLKRTGTTAETFTRAMAPGTYYLRVLFAGSTGTSYRLRLEAAAAVGSAPAPSDDNSMETARDAGVIAAGTIRAYDEYIGADDRNDFYRITITQPTRIYVKLTGLSDNADLMLLDSAGNRIAYSKRGGSADEYFQLDLAPGTFFIRVLFAGTTGSNYRLRIEGM